MSPVTHGIYSLSSRLEHNELFGGICKKLFYLSLIIHYLSSCVNISKILIKRRKLIVIIWIIAFIVSIPAITTYSNYISYNSSYSATNSVSAIASQILANVSAQNQSLIVPINENHMDL